MRSTAKLVIGASGSSHRAVPNDITAHQAEARRTMHQSFREEGGRKQKTAQEGVAGVQVSRRVPGADMCPAEWGTQRDF